MVFGREGRPQTEIDQHDDYRDGRFGQRNRTYGRGVLDRLIGRDADGGGNRVLEKWSRTERESGDVLDVCVTLVCVCVSLCMIACMSVCLVMVVCLRTCVCVCEDETMLTGVSLWHQGTRGQHHMGVRVPQGLAAEQRAVVPREPLSDVCVVLHPVQVHHCNTHTCRFMRTQHTHTCRSMRTQFLT